MTDPALLVLSSLADGDKHGYAIMTDVSDFAGVDLGPGTLYGAITRLEAKGFIKALAAVGSAAAVPAHPARPPAPAGTACRARADRARRDAPAANVMTWWMRAAVRLYPRRWRQRYQAELEALVEESGSTWRGAADMARQGLVMRLGEVPGVRSVLLVAGAATGLGRSRHHVRRLAGAPAFTATAIVTLSSAIGAVTLIFSLVHGVLLTPLPFDEPEQLVGVWFDAPGLMPGPVNQAAFSYFTYRDEATSFEDIALWTSVPATVTGRGNPEELRALAVTDGMLPVAAGAAGPGTRVHAGRRHARKPRDGHPQLTRYRQRGFDGQSTAIGQSLVVDGRGREVIGVLPPRFRFLEHAPDLLVPLRLNRARVQIGEFRFNGVARLAPGVSLERATRIWRG